MNDVFASLPYGGAENLNPARRNKMQVTNSTGRSADYRVGANTGTGGNGAQASAQAMGHPLNDPPPVEIPGEETCRALGPGETSWMDGASSVEFWVDGELVASATFTEEPGQVTLVETADGFAVESMAGAIA
jgi:hypothetical protein